MYSGLPSRQPEVFCGAPYLCRAVSLVRSCNRMQALPPSSKRIGAGCIAVSAAARAMRRSTGPRHRAFAPPSATLSIESAAVATSSTTVPTKTAACAPKRGGTVAKSEACVAKSVGIAS